MIIVVEWGNDHVQSSLRHLKKKELSALHIGKGKNVISNFIMHIK
jgi:hypothetical protein